jgi:hypothetical protein
VVVGVACIDEAGTGIHLCPGDAPADGRFEIGSVTKTMTATLLALLEAEGQTAARRRDRPVAVGGRQRLGGLRFLPPRQDWLI